MNLDMRVRQILKKVIKKMKHIVILLGIVTVKTHFYLKKDIIKKEIESWIKMAEDKDAKYQGLVLDHNHKYATRFKAKKSQYLEDLQEVYEKIKIALDSL